MNFRDQIMTLLDGDGAVVAVILRKFTFAQQIFKIYTPTPSFYHQPLSERKYEGRNLYTCAEVEERVSLSTTKSVKFAGDAAPTFTIT
jgi:hypothetical protein